MIKLCSALFESWVLFPFCSMSNAPNRPPYWIQRVNTSKQENRKQYCNKSSSLLEYYNQLPSQSTRGSYSTKGATQSVICCMDNWLVLVCNHFLTGFLSIILFFFITFFYYHSSHWQTCSPLCNFIQTWCGTQSKARRCLVGCYREEGRMCQRWTTEMAQVRAANVVTLMVIWYFKRLWEEIRKSVS